MCLIPCVPSVCVCVSHSVSASFQPSEALMEMNAASSTLQHWFNHTNRQSNLPLCVCVCVCVCVCLYNPVSSFRSDHKVQSFWEHPEACVWNSTKVRVTARFYACLCVSECARVSPHADKGGVLTRSDNLGEISSSRTSCRPSHFLELFLGPTEGFMLEIRLKMNSSEVVKRRRLLKV